MNWEQEEKHLRFRGVAVMEEEKMSIKEPKKEHKPMTGFVGPIETLTLKNDPSGRYYSLASIPCSS